MSQDPVAGSPQPDLDGEPSSHAGPGIDPSDKTAFGAFFGTVRSVIQPSQNRLRPTHPAPRLHLRNRETCLPAGVLAQTPLIAAQGRIRAGALGAGDRLCTRDHGLCQIAWVAQRAVSFDRATTAERPVRISPGALGRHSPARSLVVAPGQRVLIEGENVAALFGETAVLVHARDLVGLPGVIRDLDLREARFVHICLDGFELLESAGLAFESFVPEKQMRGGGAVVLKNSISLPPSRRLLSSDEAQRFVDLSQAEAVPAA